jgi:hypothetical protein
VLINEDSENSTTFSPGEQLELLYQLFKLFVIGGTLCQPDDKIERYLDITKRTYKELLTVFKYVIFGENCAIDVLGLIHVYCCCLQE